MKGDTKKLSAYLCKFIVENHSIQVFNLYLNIKFTPKEAETLIQSLKMNTSLIDFVMYNLSSADCVEVFHRNRKLLRNHLERTQSSPNYDINFKFL